MAQNFFYIEVRDLNFEYDRYYLSLEEKNSNIFFNNKIKINKKNELDNLPEDAISNITSFTVVPKFPIDEVLYPILYQIFNIDYNLINKKEENESNKKNNKDENNDNLENMLNEKNNIINIIKKDEEKNNNLNIIEQKNNNQEKEKEKNIKEFTINVKSFTSKKIICSFNVRYPLFPEYYDVLGKSTEKIKILQFPCVILQSISGFYCLKKIVTKKKNNKLIEEEINFAIKIEPEKHLESLFINRQRQMKPKEKNKIDFEKIMQSKGFYDSTLSNLSDKKQELLNKKKVIKELIEERKKVLEQKKKILLCHKNIEINKNSWNRLVTLKEILTKINTYIAEIISIKVKKISSCDDIIKKYEQEVENKRKKYIPNLKKINNGLQISNYLLYKYAVNELCYFFYNKKFIGYKAFPSFYKINLTDLSLSKKIVEDFYNKYTKEVSAMFGNIIFILNYISKKFDIILPYALYYNGSKSMVFINMGRKNCAIDIYMKENEKNVLSNGAKNENDIQIKMEILVKMIYDIIMFFYSKNICSDKFSIEKINKEKKNKNNIYLHFLKLNELFKDILGK